MKQQKRISRRRFLIGAAGVSILACGGAGVLAVREPEIEFSELSCGQGASDKDKVLVTYASQFGSTGGVAAAIAQALCESGVAAEARFVNNVNDLSAYRAVIVGAPVHSDEWMPEATNFVKSNRNLLSQLPVAYFLTCMTLAVDPRPEARQTIANVLEKVQQEVPEVLPLDKGLFAGALDYSKMSYVYRAMYRMFSPDPTTGDYRDWNAIRAWAEAVGSKLVGDS